MPPTRSQQRPLPARLHRGLRSTGLILMAGISGAQHGSIPRLSVTTRVVEVSVVVEDKRGQAAGDLTKDDFTVFDNGKPQAITAFVSSAGERNGAARPERRDSQGPLTWSNRNPKPGELPRTVTAVVIDGLNTGLRDQAYVKDRMLAFLRKLRAGDSVGLYFLGAELRVLHDFTADRESLAREIEDLQPRMQAQWVRESTGGVIRGILRYDRVRFTLAALRAVSKHLASIPGRKNLVWVTTGFPLLIVQNENGRPGYVQDLLPEVREAAKAIGDADVALYPVSAFGLLTGMPRMEASAGPRGNPARRGGATGPQVATSRGAYAVYGMMDEFAAPTGGRAFYDRNDLEGALQQATGDLAATYTLTFQPAHGEWNGAYRKIRVELNRKGLKVRHRPGYVAAPDGPADTRDPETVLRDALWNPLEATEVGLTVRADAPGAPLDIRVDAANVTLSAAAERWKGELLVAVVPEGGEPEVRRVSVDLAGNRYEEALKEGLLLPESVVPPRSSGNARLFVMDAVSRRVGSVNLR